MKKLIIIFLVLLAAACHTEEGIAPSNGMKNLDGSPTVVQRVECRRPTEWAATAYNNGGTSFMDWFTVQLTPQPIPPNYGMFSTVVTYKLTNTGNIPLQYRFLSIASWQTLAVGASVTTTKSISGVVECGTGWQPSVQTKDFWVRINDCPFGPNGNNQWIYKVEITGMTNLHTTSPSLPTFNGSHIYGAGTCTL